MKKLLVISIVLAVLVFAIRAGQKSISDNKLIAIAREHVTKNSVAGLVFDLRIRKQIDNWTLVEVTPKDKATDKAAVVLEKVGNRWVVRDFGTIFPERERQIPELFK